MGVLASLLPGLREIRVPLAAGYLWLLDLWLVFSDGLPDRAEAPRLLERLYALEGVLPQVGMVILVSSGAYLVGSLSEGVSTNYLRYGATAFFSSFDDYTRERTMQEMPAPDPSNEDFHYAGIAARRFGLEWRLEQLMDIRVLVMIEQPLLYGEYDRFKSEGQLRAALIPPLTWLFALLVMDFGIVFLATIVIVAALAIQALRYERQAISVLVHAVMTDKVRHPFVDSYVRGRKRPNSDQISDR